MESLKRCPRVSSFHAQYMYLAEKLDVSSSFTTSTALPEQLGGNWELEYISGPRIAFEGLYPEQKSQISFDLAHNEMNGNTTGNPFSSKFTLDESGISISEPSTMTMAACEGPGESVFLKMLHQADRYALEGGEKLLLFLGDVPIVRFHRVN